MRTLILFFGIATSGVVLSTLLEVADADYRIVVLKDCCADLDSELHNRLIDKLFPRHAQVLTASQFLDHRDSSRLLAPEARDLDLLTIFPQILSLIFD